MSINKALPLAEIGQKLCDIANAENLPNGSKYVVWWMVISGFDDSAYGPFRTLEDATEFATDMNGRIFECDIEEVNVW